MKMKFLRAVLAGLVFLCMSANLAAKANADNDGNYTTKDQEYYLTADEVFFIRPGLVIEVISIDIPDDMSPLVTFSIEDPGGLPLDIDGVFTPGPVDMRYMLAYIPIGEEQKTRLTESTRDRDGITTALGNGVYTYKFSTVLPDSYQPDATHTLGLVGRRDLREFDLDRYVDNVVHNFVPSGLYEPMPRDVVTTETCNGRCHDPLAIHGGRYQEIGICSQCHNPDLIGRSDGESKTLSVIAHKAHAESAEYPAELNDCEVCHTGGTPTENFPLVANPNPVPVCDNSSVHGTTTISWGDKGQVAVRLRSADGKTFAESGRAGSAETGKWVKDGTQFFLVDKDTGDTLQELTVNTTVLGCVGNAPGTFVGEPGAQHTNWLDHPSRAVCGACHAHVNFETGEGHASGIPQADDSKCANCHIPDSGNEFDRSIRGAHTVLYKSAQFPGARVDIIDIVDTSPGDTPTVTFMLGGKFGAIHPADMNRLRFAITGPNEDFSYYNQETVGTKAVKAGNFWTYTFEEAIPADAAGSYTVSVEGRRMVEIDFIDEVSDERDQVENSLMEFAVTAAEAKPRRMIVDDAKCESCHANLSLHGDNRKNANYCVTCHTPSATDEDEAPPEGPLQSIHMKYMVHKIHRGEDLENGYTVYGHNGSINPFGDIEYPGDLRNCDKCHIDNSQQLPVVSTALPTVTPQEWWSPMQPDAAACLSCHDTDDATAHAFSNTTIYGEGCGACHGEGKTFSVDKLHAR
jgi:hypothetical protein